MPQEVLGKISFLETPDVLGTDVLLNGGGVPSIISGSLAARPSASITGRLYLDTTNNVFYRDNGTSWDNLTALVQVSGTTNQISVTPAVVGTPAIIGLANNPVLPGTGGVVINSGTTAQRPGAPSAGTLRLNSTLASEEMYYGSEWRPMGKVLQAVSGSIAASSGTNNVPLDNTPPTSSEGNLIWTQTFTPVSANSTILVAFMVTSACSSGTANIILSTFAGSTNIGSTAARNTSANQAVNISYRMVHTPGSTATITFTARLGATAGTTYCNLVGANTLGGALTSDYSIMEMI